jgi:hypothetical protein
MNLKKRKSCSAPVDNLLHAPSSNRSNACSQAPLPSPNLTDRTTAIRKRPLTREILARRPCFPPATKPGRQASAIVTLRTVAQETRTRARGNTRQCGRGLPGQHPPRISCLAHGGRTRTRTRPAPCGSLILLAPGPAYKVLPGLDYSPRSCMPEAPAATVAAGEPARHPRLTSGPGPGLEGTS